jgi:hypothetical protein
MATSIQGRAVRKSTTSRDVNTGRRAKVRTKAAGAASGAGMPVRDPGCAGRLASRSERVLPDVLCESRATGESVEKLRWPRALAARSGRALV